MGGEIRRKLEWDNFWAVWFFRERCQTDRIQNEWLAGGSTKTSTICRVYAGKPHYKRRHGGDLAFFSEMLKVQDSFALSWLSRGNHPNHLWDHWVLDNHQRLAGKMTNGQTPSTSWSTLRLFAKALLVTQTFLTPNYQLSFQNLPPNYTTFYFSLMHLN